MHADFVGHFLQGERRHGFFATGQEAGLAFDDHARGAQQSVVAHRQAAGQPARFLQHIAQRLRGFAGLGQGLFVLRVDAEAAAGGRVQRDAPLAIGMPGDHVRNHYAVAVRQQALARPRLQRQDQADGFVDVGHFGIQLLGQSRVIVCGQPGQAVVEHALGEVAGRHAAGQGAQLHAQALVQILRGQADWIAVQDLLADRFHSGSVHIAARTGEQGELGKRGIQIAGVVAVLQPETGHGQFAVIQLHRQALQGTQLRIGGFPGRHALHAVIVTVLPTGTGHIPHGAFRQFVEGGHVLGGGGFGGVGSHRLRRFFDLEQRVGLERAADFQLQLHAVELEQPDRLQQLRGEVKLLTHLGRHGGFQSDVPFAPTPRCVMEHILLLFPCAGNQGVPESGRQIPDSV
ncbi:hypothetical protein D3C71_1297550 [compost metagenome]